MGAEEAPLLHRITGLQGGGPPHVEGRRPHLMTRNIQGPLVRDQLRLRDAKGTFQLGVHADLILLDQIDAPNAGSASTVLHLSGRLPPCLPHDLGDDLIPDFNPVLAYARACIDISSRAVPDHATGRGR